jgi:hypothetical protein
MTAKLTNLPYGIDLQTLPNADGILDLTDAMLEGSGRTLLAQSLIRRQTSPRCSFVDSPNDAIDVREWVSSGQTQSSLNNLIASLQKELSKDQRVVSCQVQATLLADNTLKLIENFRSSYGPFTLTLLVTSVTVQVLELT